MILLVAFMSRQNRSGGGYVSILVRQATRVFSDEVDAGSSKKMPPNKKLERRSNSIGSKSALDGQQRCNFQPPDLRGIAAPASHIVCTFHCLNLGQSTFPWNRTANFPALQPYRWRIIVCMNEASGQIG